MAYIKLLISYRYKALLFLTLGTSWVSGVAYFVLKNFFMIEGEFGVSPHPWQFPILKIHGAGAFLMMIIYGFFLGTHIQTAKKSNQIRKFGIAVATCFGFLILSAYGLYYLSDETFRTAVSYMHASVGFVLPGVLAGHIISGIQRKKEIKKKVNEKAKGNKT